MAALAVVRLVFVMGRAGKWVFNWPSRVIIYSLALLLSPGCCAITHAGKTSWRNKVRVRNRDGVRYCRSKRSELKSLFMN